MNAQQEIEAYRGWPVTNYGPTKTVLLSTAPDGPFVPTRLAESLSKKLDSAHKTLAAIKSMLLEQEDFDSEKACRMIEMVIGPFYENT